MASIRTIPFNLSLYTKVTSGPFQGSINTEYRDGNAFSENVVWKTITDFDHSNTGILQFKSPRVKISSTGTVTVEVERVGGCQGSVWCGIRTLSSTGACAMTEGVHFTGIDDTVWFDDQQVGSVSFDIDVGAAPEAGKHYFLVELYDPVNGVRLRNPEFYVIFDNGGINPSATILAEDADIQAAVNAASAGDMFYIQGTNSSNIRGSGQEYGGYLLTASGTKTAKIVLDSYPSNAGVISQGYATTSDGAGTGLVPCLIVQGDHIMISNLELTTSLHCGIFLQAATEGSRVEGLVLDSLNIHSLGNPSNHLSGYAIGGDSTLTIEAVTNANPAEITVTGHGLSTGTVVGIMDDVGGMTELRNYTVRITSTGTDTFTISESGGDPIDSTSWGTFTTGGTINIDAPPRTDNIGGIRLDDAYNCRVFDCTITDVYSCKSKSNPYDAEPYGLHSLLHGFRPEQSEVYNCTLSKATRGVFTKQPSNSFNIGTRVHTCKFKDITEACMTNFLAGGAYSNQAPTDTYFYNNLCVLGSYDNGDYPSMVDNTMRDQPKEVPIRQWVYGNTMIGGKVPIVSAGMTDIVIFNNNIDGSEAGLIQMDGRGGTIEGDIPIDGEDMNNIQYCDHNNSNFSGNYAVTGRYVAGRVDYADISAWQAGFSGGDIYLQRVVGTSTTSINPTYTNIGAEDYTATISGGRWGRNIGIPTDWEGPL